MTRIIFKTKHSSFQDFTSFAIICALFGLTIAAYIALTSIVLVDFCGIDNLTSAFGLLTVFRGVSSIIGPPLAGAMYEWSRSYDISFYLAATFLLMAAMFSVAADLVRRWQESRDSDEKE